MKIDYSQITFKYLLYIMVLFLLGGCNNTNAVDLPTLETNTQATTAYAEDEIVVVIPNEPDSLAWFNTSVVVIGVSRNIYEPLVTRDATGKLAPALAESWEQIDEKTWRFHLRQGVTFHDGEPFNAEAVLWHINKLSDPEYEEAGAFLFSLEVVATVVDDYTIDITSEIPDPILPRRLYWLFIGSPHDVESTEMSTPVAGTGPYMLETWEAGEKITMVSNPHYWGGEPQVKKVAFIWREDPDLRLAMVKAGDADIGQALLPDADTDVSIQLLIANIPETTFIMMTPNPPLDDLRVRQAVCMAINREATINDIFSGYGMPASQVITSDVLGYNSAIPAWVYDPDGARALLDEARADGVDVDQVITLFGRLTMYTNATKDMENLQLWLSEIGLNVTLEMLEVEDWRTNIRMKPFPENWPVIFQSSHGNEAGDAVFPLLNYYDSNGRVNKFHDDTLDELIYAALPLTGEARQAALAEAIAYHHDQVLQNCPMVHRQAVWGISDRIIWEPRFDNIILINTVTIKN